MYTIQQALYFDKIYRWTNHSFRHYQLVRARYNVQLLFPEYFEAGVQKSMVEEIFDAVTAGN